MKRALFLALFVSLLPVTACGEGADATENLVREAIRKTERTPRSFSYSESSNQRLKQVQGIIQDDYRYKAQLISGRNPVLEEIVLDDTVAVRFLDPDAIGEFVSEGLTSGSIAPTPTDTKVLDELRGRRWVIDRVGAPEVVLPAGRASRIKPGEDPVTDGLRALAEITRAIDSAETVIRFNPDSSQYRKEEDVFPRPNGAEVVRYDVIAPAMPIPNQLGQGATAGAGAPETFHFRQVAIYIRRGLVVEARERIFASRRQLDHLREFFNIKQTGTEAAIAALNEQVKGAGGDPIRVRTMILKFVDLGQAKEVSLPNESSEGSLRLLRGRGRAPTLKPAA